MAVKEEAYEGDIPWTVENDRGIAGAPKGPSTTIPTSSTYSGWSAYEEMWRKWQQTGTLTPPKVPQTPAPAPHAPGRGDIEGIYAPGPGEAVKPAPTAPKVVTQPAPPPRVTEKSMEQWPAQQDYWVVGHRYPYMPEHPIYNPPMLHNPYTDDWKPIEGDVGAAAPTPAGGYGYGTSTAPAAPSPAIGAAEPEPPPFGQLAWWTPEQLTPYLRPWGSYLRELLELSRAPGGIAPETFFGSEAEQLAGEAAQTSPGKLSTKDVVSRLRVLFGFGEGWGQEMSLEERWQAVIDKMTGIGAEDTDLETQQLLSSLRYEPDLGWYTVDIPLLQHPEYT